MLTRLVITLHSVQVLHYNTVHLKQVFPGGSDGKEFACNTGDPGSIPGSGKSPWEGMAAHFSILAWRTPWSEESGGLQSMESQSVRNDWVTDTFRAETSEKWNISCHVGKQRMSRSSAISATTRWWAGELQATQEEYLLSSSLQTIATPYSEPWRNSGSENTGYWPQMAEMYIKRMISVSPDSCIFQYK